MNLEDIAAWLHELRVIASGCRLELTPFELTGVMLTLRWENQGRMMAYQHALSGIELRNMVAVAQKQILALIRIRVEDMMRPNVEITGAEPASSAERPR